MAFASSKIGAQAAMIKPCDLCEEEENVNWFCKDCDQNICDRCKITHLRSNVSKSHTVLSFTEGFAYGKRNVSNICPDHIEIFLMFCKTCGTNICLKCLSSDHKKHDFIDLQELQSEMETELNNVIRNKEEERKEMLKKYEELSRHENESKDHFQACYATIHDRMKAIKFVVDEEGKKLKTSLQSKEQQHDRKINEGKQKLMMQADLYDREIKTIREEFRLQTAATRNHFHEESLSKLKSLRPLKIMTPSLVNMLREGKVDESQIRNMIGSNTESNIAKKEGDFNKPEDEIQIEVAGIMKLNEIKKAYCMCVCRDGTTWIGGSGLVYMMNRDCSSILDQIRTRRFQMSFTSGVTRKSSKVHLLQCSHIACLQSGDAVVSYAGPLSFVDKFTAHGERKDFLDLTPRIAYDLAINGRDEVVINVGRESIMICKPDGQQIRDIRISGGIRTFCMGSDENFVVAQPDSLKFAVIDGSSGNVTSTWPGTTSEISNLTCDRFGNIFALHRKTDISIFGKGGDVKKRFEMECDWISGICAFEDHLLILLRRDGNYQVLKTRYLK